MPRITSAKLRELRQRYNAAYTAHQDCIIVLNQATLAGKPASQRMLDAEIKTQRDLAETRSKLHAAMAEMDRQRVDD